MAGYDTGHNARMRRLHEDAAEIHIDPITDPVSRAKALADPVFFVEHCCAQTLRHQVPPALQDFIRQIVTSVKGGGNMMAVLGRGTGKTTLLTDTLLWCIVTGLVHFPVVVAANQQAANNIVRNLWKIVETSQPLHECFPELTSPVRALNGRHQRCASQHIGGVRTNLKFSASQIHFGDVNGVPGASVVARGSGASVRGLLDASTGQRPDFVFLDDPQKKASIARSQTQLDQLQEYIDSDLRGLGGSDASISIFIAATPMAPGDIVDRLSRRPDVMTIRRPLVSSWPKRTDLWENYTDLLYGDLADNTDNAHQFYLAHKSEMDDGAEVIDPLAYPPTMASAIERVYYLKATMADGFNQEYMLTPSAEKESIALDATEVSKKLSLVPHRIVPADCSVIIAAIDVGTATALHVTVTAYGRHQKAAVIDAYRFPEEGRLLPKNLPQDQADVLLTKALVGVVANLVAPGRYRQEGTGKTVPVTAVAIDRGYRTNVVDNVAAYFNRRRIAVYPAKGFANQQYRPNRYTIGKAKDVDLREDATRRFLAYNADTLKVLVLTAFQGEPLTTGSLCLWGSESGKVYKVATQIAGEKLSERIETFRGTLYRFVPSSIGAQNHVLDSLVMNIGLATWLRYREPDAMKNIVETQNQTSTTSAEIPRIPAVPRTRPTRRRTIIKLK